jgi:hypothetical protein
MGVVELGQTFLEIWPGSLSTTSPCYEPPYFPFRSLSAAAHGLDLSGMTGTTGEKFLQENQVSCPLIAIHSDQKYCVKPAKLPQYVRYRRSFHRISSRLVRA